MQQCRLKLVSHCLGSGAALEKMFAWLIVAYLHNLEANFGFWEVFLGRSWLKMTFSKHKILLV